MAKEEIPTITRSTLPNILQEYGPHWSSRITKYVSRESDLRKITNNPLFSANVGLTIELGNFRLREIGSLGSIESGSLERIVELTVPDGGENHFPDLLGELCEDSTGTLQQWASAELRAQLDWARFKFNEYALVGDVPVLSGVKKRTDQIRTINGLSRAASGGDKALARALALVLADNIDNLEPSAVLS